MGAIGFHSCTEKKFGRSGLARSQWMFLSAKTRLRYFIRFSASRLKVGKNRFSCPDLATARYLQVFARIGCRSVAIPYDITKISVLADELEVAWHKLLLIHDKNIGQKSPQAKGRSRSALIRQIRDEINELGAGDAMPEFKNSTRQRNS